MRSEAILAFAALSLTGCGGLESTNGQEAVSPPPENAASNELVAAETPEKEKCPLLPDHKWAAWYDETSATSARTLNVVGLVRVGRGGYRLSLDPLPATGDAPKVQRFNLAFTPPAGMGIAQVVPHRVDGKVLAPTDVQKVVIDCAGGEIQTITKFYTGLPIGFNPDAPEANAQ